MANLSGQTIQSTYPGLLNLNTATTGITSTPQAITDGFGNDTGLKIRTNSLTGPNLYGIFSQFVCDYGGVGFGAGAAANPVNQNRLTYNVFYDTGFNAYSALTVNMVSATTTTNDVVNWSFYTAQYVPNFGIAPKDLIVSGITVPSTGATGVKVVTLPSTLSFSGTGPGYYIYAYISTGSGSSPTVRYGNRITTAGTFSGLDTLGFTLNPAGNNLVQTYRIGTPSAISCILSSVLSSYTASDVTSSFINANGNAWGFGLNTIR